MSLNLIKLSSKGDYLIDQESIKYWDDEENEKHKIFNFKDRGFNDIEKSKKYIYLLNHINTLFDKHKVDYKNNNILSIASGSCWIESQIFQDQKFKNLTCIDVSQHRIHKLAPLTFNHYGFKVGVNLIHGSIFDIGEVKKSTYDVVLLCQAFHHIDEPIRLLRILKNIMNNNGIIIITGEHYYSNLEYHKRSIKHFIKYFINHNNYRDLHNIYPSWQDLFKPCYQKGDIHWSLSEYDFIFKKAGFSNFHHHINNSKRYQSFVLRQIENTI